MEKNNQFGWSNIGHWWKTYIYINSVANNSLDGSETFQGDINFNNDRIKNIHTPVSNYDAVNQLFCDTTYRKLINDD